MRGRDRDLVRRSATLSSGKPKDRGPGGAEEFNAFFYSLVSTDTQEMYFSTKRQQFLIDQGYSFKVLTSIPPSDSGPELSYFHQNEQLDLLGKLEEDVDDITQLSARRTIGSMSAMSGACGMVYMEYSTGRSQGSSQGKPKKCDPNKPRHQLFKKRFA